MDSSTRLVGDFILGLLNTMMIRLLEKKVMMIRMGMMKPYTGRMMSRGPIQEEALTK